MKRYQEWANRKYSARQQVITLVLAGILFVLILPFLLLDTSARIDEWLQLPRFYAGAVNLILGALVVVTGYALALWSIHAQITIGSGTPVPLMPTQRLIVRPPFTWCRNPMTLGTIIGYAGFGVLTGSFAALGLVLIFALLLITYLKLVEEKELAARFGAEYLEYKRTTPFILPRFHRRT